MDIINTYKYPNGMRNIFDYAATNTLLYGPVQKKRIYCSRNKLGSSEISDATDKEAYIYAFGEKQGTGNTGFHIQCHYTGY